MDRHPVPQPDRHVLLEHDVDGQGLERGAIREPASRTRVPGSNPVSRPVRAAGSGLEGANVFGSSLMAGSSAQRAGTGVGPVHVVGAGGTGASLRPIDGSGQAVLDAARARFAERGSAGTTIPGGSPRTPGWTPPRWCSTEVPTLTGADREVLVRLVGPAVRSVSPEPLRPRAPPTMTRVSSSRRAGRDEREVRALRRATRALDRPVTAATLRQRLEGLHEAGTAAGADVLESSVDVYGDGVVTALEQRVAGLLGTEDAAFFPSGTMAQQAALRCWTRRGAGGGARGAVALHALSHPRVHESDTFTHLAGLPTTLVTTAPRPTTAEDVRTHPEPFAALVLELPLRDAGYLLPTWDELVAVTTAARERGAAVHLDGARLWETTTRFGRPLHEIAALADSVYVSFYKSLRGLSGAALAGPRDLVEQARLERHRYGGNLFQQFPAALTALNGLQHELPRLPRQVEHARVVADALARGLATAGVPWSAVHPAVPHTHQFQLWLPHPAADLAEATTRQAERSGTALFTNPWREPGLPPGLSCTEITVGEAGLAWSADDVGAALVEFLDVLGAVRAGGGRPPRVP